jgi:FkbM family methyltransferase
LVLHRLLNYAKSISTHDDFLRDPTLRFLGRMMADGHKSISQLFQDIWVLHETDGMRGGVFVEFGAADGSYLSNSALLERDYGWTGLLAEPAPRWHEALGRNRRTRISHKCVWSVSGETLVFAQTTDPVYSTIKSYAEIDCHSEIRRDAQEMRVETISLGDLLAEHDMPKQIDYISIDTEGSELDILKTFDFSRWDVRLFSVEYNDAENEAKLDALMADKGYVRCFAKFSTFDAWFKKI